MSSLATSLELERIKQMLKRKTELLEDFILNNNAIPTTEKCQILRRRIDLVEDEISRAGITEAANSWLKHAGLEGASCGNPSPRTQNLENPGSNPPRSMAKAAPALKKRPQTVISSDHRPALQSREGGDSGSSSSPISIDGNELLHPSPPTPSIQASKRIKLTTEDITPCLRCKILKKKCDSLTHCTHCPQQNWNNGNDYWKVLGCIRGPLQNLSSVFCPDFARSPIRTLKCVAEESQIVEFVLAKSKVSPGKKKRILYLLKAREDFSQLADSSWDNLSVRGLLCRMAAATHALAENDLPGEILSLEDHEAAWALLQAVAMDNKYVEQTEYNPFRLLRLGNKFSKEDPAVWEIFRKAKVLLRQAVEVYLLESLCRQIATGAFSGPPPFDPSRLPASKALILIDIKADLEDFLSDFETICSGRAKLAGPAQISCLYALLVFSIAKSVLIDAYSIRSVSDFIDPWNEAYAFRITSAFKALIGVFASASKSDVILQDERSLDEGSSDLLRESRELVNLQRWNELGFKTTRDFLLSLGCFVLSGGVYNGFFAQKFGIEAIPKYSPMSSSGNDNGTRSQKRSPTIHESMIHTFSVSPTSAAISRRDESPISTKTLSPGPETSSRTSKIATAASTSMSSPTYANFTFISHDKDSKREHCRRRGALDEATLRKSREVRKLGACWNCWLMKVPCSEGFPCEKCKKCLRHSPLQICSRAPLTTHSELFFPEFLNSHLDINALRNYIGETISCHNGAPVPIEVAWIGDAPIKLLASAFVPTPEAAAQQKYQSRSGEFLGVESLPIGLFHADESAIERACLAHFETLLEDPALPFLLTGNRSAISKEVLQTICNIYHLNKHPLLHDILLFYLIVFVMGRQVLFTQSLAATIVGIIEGDFSKSKHFSSRLLNRQMKRIINLASYKILDRVLSSLEKVLRSRQFSLWSVSISTILILCLCVEKIQAQADAHIATLKASSILPEHLIQEPQQSCGSLEDMLFSHLIPIFHTVYQTRQGGTNPLVYTPTQISDQNMERSDIEIIGSLQSIMFNDNELSKHNRLEEAHWGTEDFAKHNSGRIVARFLSMFHDSSPT